MHPLRVFRFLVFLLLLAGIAGAQSKSLRYSLPHKQGALELRLPGLELKESSMNPDGSGVRIMAENDEGLMLTAFVLPAQRAGDSRVCREEWWSKKLKLRESKVKMKDVRLYESGAAAIAEYRVPEWQGVAVNQKSLHAYYAGGELWAEIHISKTPFRAGDEKLFDAVLETARVDPSYTPGVMDYFVFGSLRYQERDYTRAAEYYQRALDLEKKESKLDRKYWKVLVDNLGMSYGISREFSRAKEVFEYGISQDANYPLFYYNLACTYAEMDDLDNAINQLNKAFELRQNVLPGEKMPDPMEDDSFKRFTRNPKFVEAVKKLPRS
jgi:tetratricopeptide (TPR) repeat protein